jgi:hypothetical protein
MTQSKRFRNQGGRLMLELLYNDSDYVQRGDGMVRYTLARMSTDIQMRSALQVELLMWLQEIGLISDLTIGRKDVSVRVKTPESMVHTGEAPPKDLYAERITG